MKTFTIILLAFIALHTENFSLKLWITIFVVIALIYEIYNNNDNNNNLKPN
jgi:hypothetical protein